MLCKQQVAQLRGIADRIHEKGAEVIVIGSGSVAAARQFRDEQQVSFPLFTDPSRRSYEAAGLKRGLLTTLSPSVVVKGITALKEGFRQSGTEGDPLQQGGAFVFAAGGQELFSYISETAGDHPAPELLLAALG